MNRIRIFFALLLWWCLDAEAQRSGKIRKTSWVNWYDSAAFFEGPEPLIQGLGSRSKELSEKHGGRVIFEHDEKYYLINNLADYYFWFTRKYEFLFKKEIWIYESFYFQHDSYNQALFIKKNYTGKRLPAKYRFHQMPHHKQDFVDANPSGIKHNHFFRRNSSRPETIQKFKNGRRVGS